MADNIKRGALNGKFIKAVTSREKKVCEYHHDELVSKHRRPGYVVELSPAYLKAQQSTEVDKAAIR